jgi:branched-chain amino acid transport system permease protein
MINRIREFRSVILATIGGMFFLLFPLFSGFYWQHIFILMFLNVILVMSFRLFYVTGLGSFCHITFYGIGAYSSSLLSLKLGIPIGFCILAAGVIPAVVASLLAWPAVRAKGPYFFIISFAFWAVMDTIFRHWKSLTQGPMGISKIPPIMGFRSIMFYYYFALLFCALIGFILYRFDRSRFGAELIAIGDDDDLSETIGINVVGHKVLSFAIGAFFAGMAGSIYAHYIRFISPNSFGLWPTVYIVIWCVLGGERKFWGPIAGAVLLTLIAEILRMSGVWQGIFYAVALLIVVMTMPHGLAGLVDTLKIRHIRKNSMQRHQKVKRKKISEYLRSG